MRKGSRIRILLALGLAVLLIFSGQKVKAEENQTLPKHIILISIDGLNKEGYSSFQKNNLRYLASDGAATDSCLGVMGDSVEASEASLLTGCLPEEHKHYGHRDRVLAQSLLDVFSKAGHSVLVVDGSGGKLQGFARGDKEYIKIGADKPDAEVMKKATELFLSRKPFFTYIYLNDCKDAIIGSSSKDQSQNLRETDLALGKMIKSLKDYSVFDSTALVVTASRTSSSSDMVPLIIRAPGIKKNYALSGACVVDVAPTLCGLAGLDGPVNSSGFGLWNAFMAEKENELIARQVKELRAERSKIWKKYYEMVRERDRYNHQIEAIKEERENIFNFAGEKEQTIARLQSHINRNRGLLAGVVLVLLAGYVVEYRLLKKKFLLFK